MRWWLRAAVLSLLAGAGGEEQPRGAGGAAGPVWPVAGPGGGGGQLGTAVAGGSGGGRKVPVCRGGIGLGPEEAWGDGSGGSGMVPVCPAPIPVPPVSPWAGAGPAGSGRSEPRAVVGRVGGSAVLGCGLLGAHETRPPLYVIEWVRFGFVLPIFIKFGLYSPRVDPEYAGESRGRGWRGFWGHCGVCWVSTRCAWVLPGAAAVGPP